MFCQSCGEKLSEGDHFCTKCGLPLAAEAGVAVQSPMVARRGQVGGKAIAAFVLGICSLLCWCLTGIPAIIFGKIALNDIRDGREAQEGKVFAMTGFVMGIIVTSLALLYGIIIVLGVIFGNGR